MKKLLAVLVTVLALSQSASSQILYHIYRHVDGQWWSAYGPELPNGLIESTPKGSRFYLQRDNLQTGAVAGWHEWDGAAWVRDPPGGGGTGTGLTIFDVTDSEYGADGSDLVADTAAIDEAVAAAQAAGGGVVYFPPGNYIYSGAGIVNNPGALVSEPLVIQGAGTGLSQLTCSAISNPECIRLSSQSSMGSGLNYGSGIRDIYITAGLDAAFDLVRIENQESWFVYNVNTFGGDDAFVMDENRKGRMEAVYADRFGTDGLKMICEDLCDADVFDDVVLIGHTSSAWGVNYTRTTVNETVGSPYFRQVVVYGDLLGAFKFEASVAQRIWVFLDRCVADGNFPSGAFFFKNVNLIHLSGNWSVAHANGASAYVFDNVETVTMTGGTAHADGTGSSDFEFLNSCSRFTIKGVSVTGGVLAYETDATQHTYMEIDNPAPTGGTFSDDLPKLIDSGIAARPVSPFTLMGPLGTAYATKSSDYTLTAADSVVMCDTSGAVRTMTLPTAVGATGRQYTIKRIGANNCVIDGNGAETVDDGASLTIAVNYGAYVLVSDGDEWYVLANY